MSDVAFLSIAELLAGFDAGRFTSQDATRWLLDRAEAFARLNAFVRLDAEEAIKAAVLADATRRRGESRPLGGVPLAHKDMMFRADRVSTCGSRGFATRAAHETATVLDRLDQAGAIDLGTLHMSEFAHNSTGHNAFLGPARNPWNTAHIAGGSSSGPGVAVAAGLAYAALGSDTGGSIRLPCHFCGVTGMKPTSGRVSRAGTMPLSFSLDAIGPMARSVEDVARVLAQIAGPDEADPTTEMPAEADLVAASIASSDGLVIGIPDAFYMEGLSDDVAWVLDEAIRTFERLGVAMRRISLPDQDALCAAQLILVASEAASQHRDALLATPDLYEPQIRNRLLNGFGYGALDYLAALRSRGPALQAHLAACAGVDAMLTPVAPFAAPTLEETDIGGSPDAESLIQSISRFMRPANYLGLPALAFPAGFSQAGLPIGLQLVGRPFDEATLLKLGGTFQKATDHHRQRPEGMARHA